MLSDVRTRSGLIRRITLVTLMSVGASVLATAILFPFVFGLDLGRTFTMQNAIAISVVLSISVPAVATPVISYWACMMMREIQLARDAFEQLSRIDQLTGLANRRGFDELALAAVAAADAASGPVSALMIDIDSFKTFNDEFGHGFGDAALLHVANILRSATMCARAILGRQGGDEFAIIVVGADAASAAAHAEQVRAQCAANPVRVDGKAARISLSVGIATASGRQEPLTRLMSMADAALIAAKRQGRDRVVCAEAPGGEHAGRRAEAGHEAYSVA